MPEEKPVKPFRGFLSPNYTSVPDELFDELLPELSGSELKVLLYIIRRTFGFKRDDDNISLSQMLGGIVTHDGRVLDRGAGIKDKKTLLAAIKSLNERKIIVTERKQSAARGNEPTTYSLNMRKKGDGGNSPLPLGGKPHQGVGGEILPSPWGANPATQETGSQQTDLDLSNFEGSHDHMRMETTGESPRRLAATDARGGSERRRGTGAPGLKPLGEILSQRAAAMSRPDGAPDSATGGGEHVPVEPPPPQRRGRAAADPEERERLRAFLDDFARELGDEAPLSSTITRTLNIFTAATVPPERWSDLLYQARGLTQEHTAQIRKTANADGDQFRRKNKMPYFLATLEQLVGLRPDGRDETEDAPGLHNEDDLSVT
jgi:hypothetical protein